MRVAKVKSAKPSLEPISVELARSPKLKREMKKYRNEEFEFTARNVAFFDAAEEQWKPGQHGALDIVQSRAPLAFAGPGIRPGHYSAGPRHVDIAPTICALMRFPLIDGKDWSGRVPHAGEF